jgi:serine/threonine protein kinase
VGGYRGVFIPDCLKDGERRCLKVVLPSRRRKIRERTTNFFKNLRPTRWHDENIKDIRAYGILSRKNPIVFDHIPRYYGTYKTNLGRGLMVEYVDGISLREYVEKYGIDEKIQNAILKMLKVFYENNVQIRDQHLDNYIVGDNTQIKLVDGIGCSSLISLGDIFPMWGRKKLLKRIRKFFMALRKNFPAHGECIDNIENKFRNG